MFVYTVKFVREDKNVSLTDLHEKTNISLSYLYKIDDNKINYINLFALSKISKILDVEVKELFYSVEEVFKLKKSMYYHIERYGISHAKTLRISQTIDLIVTKIAQQEIDSTSRLI